MMIRTVVFLSCLIGLSHLLSAQDTIDLATVQAMARMESPTARQAALSAYMADQQYTAFQAGFKPQLRLNGDLPGFSRSITGILQDDGGTVFRSQNQIYSFATLALVQAIPFTGGQLSVLSSLANFTRFGNGGGASWQASPVGLRLNQPLFQLNQYRWDRQEEIAKLTLAELKALRTREAAVQEATDVYLKTWLAWERQQQAQKRIQQSDSIYRIAEARHQIGKVSEEQLLQSELALLQAQTTLEQQEVTYRQSLVRLLTLLGLPPEATWRRLRAPDAPAPLRTTPEEAAALAWQYSDMQPTQRLESLMAEREIAMVQQDNRFQIDLVASVGFNQSGNTLSEAYQNLEDQQALSLGISLPLLQWGAGRAKVEVAQSTLQQAQIGQQQAMRTYMDEIQSLVMQISLLQSQLTRLQQAMSVAQRLYRFSIARFELGKLALPELLLAQRQQFQAEESYWLLLQKLQISYAKLRTQTLYDFERNQPLSPQFDR